MGKNNTPTFFLQLPLHVNAHDAKVLHAHFEAARCLYNALLGEARSRLVSMRRDPQWQAARVLPKQDKQARRDAFNALREQYRFSEYALHAYTTRANTAWIADHIDANTAQKLASRAYHAVNRMCVGQAKKVRFKSRGRGIDSIEGKTNKQGIRFLLPSPQDDKNGYFVWGKLKLMALIDWHDPVVCHGLKHRIKYVRLIRQRASSPNAHGTDREGYRYAVQLALEGVPYQKPKHVIGGETVGLDSGPSSVAIVSQMGDARLISIGAELNDDHKTTRRLQRKLDRQRRANNPYNYDAKGRTKKGRLKWKESHGYKVTRRRLAAQKRRQAAHRKSVHGRIVHEIVSMGNTIITEKISYKAWQKRYGKSVGKHAPGMFVAQLARTVASTGGILHEVSTYATKLSQYCHGCQTYTKKPLSQRWHDCTCGIGPVQRNLYSACLAAFLDLRTSVPSIGPEKWESVEMHLQTAIEDVKQRANAGYVLPQSMGIPRAGVRLSKRLDALQQELRFHHGRVEVP